MEWRIGYWGIRFALRNAEKALQAEEAGGSEEKRAEET